LIALALFRRVPRARSLIAVTPMIRPVVLVTVALGAVALAACGSDTPRPTGEAARAAATSRPVATVDPAEAPRTSKTKRRRHRIALTACDANIKIKAATTTCAFAQNVFYEYWQAAQSDDGSFIRAYSAASRRTYALQCSERTVITCRANDGSYVAFPAGAVDAYDANQATRFACSHDLGPSESDACSNGRTDDEASHSGGSGDECDSNYAGACLDPSSIDYDCEGGTGDGPDYTGQVEVIGDDHYGLDRDGDGTGCDDSGGSSSDPSSGYDPDSPTTEDFGSGSGSVGQCADGTISDSIGRPGACSHHGGVG
jgi:hypothetical protein